MTSLAGWSFFQKLRIPRVKDGLVDLGEGVLATVSVQVTRLGGDLYGFPYPSVEPVLVRV